MCNQKLKYYYEIKLSSPLNTYHSVVALVPTTHQDDDDDDYGCANSPASFRYCCDNLFPDGRETIFERDSSSYSGRR